MSDEPKKKKTSAKINWGWDAPENRNGKATRKVKSSAKKTFRSIGVKGILIILLFFIIGAGIGVGITYFISKDDCFVINGVDEITLCLGDVNSDEWMYQDEGVKAISLGRDISSNVIIETNLKTNDNGKYYAESEGTYYMIYKFDDIKYGKIFTVERIRLITFVEMQEDERNDDVAGGGV